MTKLRPINVVLAILLSISLLEVSYVLYKHFSGNDTKSGAVDLFYARLIQQRSLLREDVLSLAESNSQYENFDDIHVFLYHNEYTERYQFVTSGDQVLGGVSIDSDPAYVSALNLHRSGECYVNNTEMMPDGKLKTILITNNLVATHNYYISCPIVISDSLAGYVSSVFHEEKAGVFVHYNNFKIVRNIIEDKLETLL